MTMLDDQLSSLLARAADEFEVPASGPDEIVRRARALKSERTGPEEGAGDALGDGLVATWHRRRTAARVRRPGGGRVACAGSARRRPATACCRWRRASSCSSSWQQSAGPSAVARRTRPPPRACARPERRLRSEPRRRPRPACPRPSARTTHRLRPAAAVPPTPVPPTPVPPTVVADGPAGPVVAPHHDGSRNRRAAQRGGRPVGQD